MNYHNVSLKASLKPFATDTASKAHVLLNLLSQHCFQKMFAFFVKMCEFYSVKNWNVVFNAFYFAKHQVIHKVVIVAFSSLQWINPDLVDICACFLWRQNMD